MKSFFELQKQESADARNDGPRKDADRRDTETQAKGHSGINGHPTGRISRIVTPSRTDQTEKISSVG